MSDFTVSIDSKLDLTTAREQLNTFITNSKSDPLKIKLELDTKSINTSSFGRQLQSGIASSVKNVKFNGTTFYKEYFNQAKKDIAEAKNVEKQFNKSLSEIDTTGIDKNAIKAANAMKNAQQKILKEAQKAQAEIAKIREKEYESYDNPKRDAYQSLGNTSETLKQMRAYYEQIEEEARKQAQQTAKVISQVNQNIFDGTYDAKSSTMTSRLSTYKNQDSELLKIAKEQAEIYDNALSNLKRHFDSNDAFTMNDKEIVNSFNNMDSAAKKFDNTIKSIGKPFNQLDATIAGNKTLTWLKNNSKAAKDYGEALTNLAEKQKNATNADELKEYTKQVNKIKTEAAAVGKTGNSFLADTKRAFGQIFQFTTVYGTLQRIPQVLKQMTNAVIEIDTAMTNLKKVTDETDARYSEFLTNASQNAKSLGRDVSSYITQTSEWAKLGYSMNSSSELAKVSSIYANVGEVDDKTAVSDLVTVMKAYNMQDSQAMDIADMLNELGNNYATSAGDLGAGLTKMASTMSMSNVSLEKSLAILTGGTEITQNAEELGNAIKVSVLRMRGQKGALEDIGENADDIESVSKMQTQILNMTKGAVNIMDSADPTKFRDYYDVMADIAEVLPKLSETDQANLIETLFGKNRANQGQAILQAFQSGQIQKAYQTALNSAGSAQKEQDRWRLKFNNSRHNFRIYHHLQ